MYLELPILQASKLHKALNVPQSTTKTTKTTNTTNATKITNTTNIAHQGDNSYNKINTTLSNEKLKLIDRVVNESFNDIGNLQEHKNNIAKVIRSFDKGQELKEAYISTVAHSIVKYSIQKNVPQFEDVEEKYATLLKRLAEEKDPGKQKEIKETLETLDAKLADQMQAEEYQTAFGGGPKSK